MGQTSKCQYYFFVNFYFLALARNNAITNNNYFYGMSSRKAKKSSSSLYTPHNKVKLVRAGNAYFGLLKEMITRASISIHLQTYIFEDDETGREVAAELVNATKRKVQVYVMADAYASGDLPIPFVNQLKEAGVQFRFFEPLFKSKHFYIGRRLHHKLVVADATFCMVGGINIGDRYNDTAQGSAWLDFALYAEGPIAQQVYKVALKTWKGFPLKLALPQSLGQQMVADIELGATSEVRLRQNDWVRSKNQISKTYREMLSTASNRVTFLCSYFMPGNLMKKYLLYALKRGVYIKVIMAGRSDVWVAKNAERFMYDWLLRNKVEIFEYQGNMLHGKLAVCDGEWMTIGSYNVNNISAYASVELNLDVKDAPFAKHVEEVLEEIIAQTCTPVTREQMAKTKNIFKQFVRWCSYEFIRLMIFLFTFYFKRER
jgi:cardiolipin synthase